MIICLHCSSPFNGTSERKFCSRSCSTSHTNRGKSRTEAEKSKASKTLRKTLESKEIYPRTSVYFKTCVNCLKSYWTKRSESKVCSKKCQSLICSALKMGTTRKSTVYRGKPTKAYLKDIGLIENPKNSRVQRRENIQKTCLICSAIFETNDGPKGRKTCSKDCHYQLLSGKIGHTTHPEHVCKDGKKIVLGSSWEKSIAIFLDEKEIRWIRPKSLEYLDESGKKRKYFPDFYLPDYDIYLDPKNPMKIKADQYKLDYFKDKIVLHYGTIQSIKERLVGTLGIEPRPPGNPPAPLRSGV